MSDFKKQIVIQWFPKDWLSDPNVRVLSPAAKGFWSDLLNQLASFFPYGHCTVLNMSKVRELSEKDRAIKKILTSVEGSVKGGDNPPDNPEDKLWVTLSLYLPLDIQLQMVDNMEDKLDRFLPYEATQIPGYLQELEERNIYSRTPAGIIYSRRLVRDFRTRVTNYLNGKQGGNPSLKALGKKAKGSQKWDNRPVNPPLNPGVENLDNRFIENSDNRSYGYGYGYNNTGISVGNGGNEGGPGETQGGQSTDPEFFPMQYLVDMPYDQISKLAGVGKGITQEEFANWKAFVEHVRQRRYFDLYRCRFILPEDFARVVRVYRFSQEKWDPVLLKLLSTGVKEEHNLNFRLPDFINIVYKSKKNSALDTGEVTYDGQDEWS